MTLLRRFVILTPMIAAVIDADGGTTALAYFVLTSNDQRPRTEISGTTIAAPTVGSDETLPTEEPPGEETPAATTAAIEEPEVAQVREVPPPDAAVTVTPTPRVLTRPNPAGTATPSPT